MNMRFYSFDDSIAFAFVFLYLCHLICPTSFTTHTALASRACSKELSTLPVGIKDDDTHWSEVTRRPAMTNSNMVSSEAQTFSNFAHSRSKSLFRISVMGHLVANVRQLLHNTCKCSFCACHGVRKILPRPSPVSIPTIIISDDRQLQTPPLASREWSQDAQRACAKRQTVQEVQAACQDGSRVPLI